MGVRLKNWDKAGKMLEMAANNFDSSVDDALMRAAKIYQKSLQELIASGHPSWVPKSDDQIKRSGTAQLFVSSGDFSEKITEAIAIRRVGGKKGMKRVFVGARADIAHGPSNLSMERIAGILQNLPKEGDRPLFGPAYERVRREIEATLNDAGRDI